MPFKGKGIMLSNPWEMTRPRDLFQQHWKRFGTGEKILCIAGHGPGGIRTLGLPHAKRALYH